MLLLTKKKRIKVKTIFSLL